LPKKVILLPGNVASSDAWASLAVAVREDRLEFDYNGLQQWQGEIPAAAGERVFRVGFVSDRTPVAIKDVFLDTW